ncbi:hypothetical protein TWF730_003368 [Orbilia blumenaviensis]|uniref:Protein kinase domain-containing protein n=1 Tax=Orbilia blumenaviensis TaxID=1796055 RepID=A0AAV9U9I7_9PEZI
MENKDSVSIGALRRTFTDQSLDVVELAETLSTSSISQDILVLGSESVKDDTSICDSWEEVSTGEISRSNTTSSISADYAYDPSASSGLTSFFSRGTFSSSASIGNYTRSYDIIDFLAVAQHRRLSLIPFNWNPASEVGLGGTAKITQAATVSLVYGNGVENELRYVVKRFQAEGARHQDRDMAYQGLLSEAYILGHPVVRHHPNINSMEGIAFDVISDEAWPVLLFRMSKHGDLRQFMRTEEGKRLSFEDRVRLCWEIGQAILLMHSWYCIHGDLKPENILIFQDEDQKFLAKVTDFGYSSVFAQGNETLEITLARSWPWTAPEVEENSRVTFEQGKSADIFSYGLICAWLLCYDRLPTKEPQKFGPDMEEFAILKRDPNLIEKVTHSVWRYVEGNSTESLAVTSLFELTLARDRNKRDLKAPLDNLGLPFGFKRTTQPIHQEYGRSSILMTYAEFDLVKMLSQLRFCGEEVRKSIFESLKSRAQNGPNSASVQKAAYDLALSYYIGFGTSIDKDESVKWLHISNRSQESLDEIVKMMAADSLSLYYAANEKTHYSAYLKSRGETSIPAPVVSAIFNQERSEDIDEDELGLRGTGEIIVLMENIRYQLYRMIGYIYDGPDKWLKPGWMSGVHGIKMNFHGRYKNKPLIIGEALKITITPENPKRMEDHIKAVVESLEAKTSILSLEHEDTLRDLLALSHLYTECGRWDDAESLLISIVGIQRDFLGPDNPLTLRSMERLAKVLIEKLCWKEAEDVTFQIVDIRMAISRTQLEHHRFSMEILMDLIKGYSANDMEELTELPWKKLLEVFRAGARIGGKTELVLLAMLKLAQVYMKNQKFEEAERLLEELVHKAEEFYGKETTSVFEAKYFLAAAYILQSDENPEMFLKAHELLIEIRNFLSNLSDSKSSSTGQNFVHRVDIGSLRSNTENLWSLIEGRLDSSRTIDAVQKAEEALENLPEDSPDRTDVLATLSEALVARFNLLNDQDDLDTGIMWAEQALLILPEDHPRRAQRLADLGSALWHRYIFNPSFSDLETSIRYAEESVLSTEDGDFLLAERLQVLVARLDERYEKYEDLDDLNKAIVFLEQLTYLIGEDDEKYTYWIYKLGIWYKQKWKLFDDQGDLDEAINALERLEPVKDTLKRATLFSIYTELANLYGDRVSISQTGNDLDKAIAKFEECLEIAGNGETGILDELEGMGFSYGSTAADLAFFYLIRFSRGQNFVDLTNAKERIEIAEALVPLENQERGKVEGTKIIIRRICDKVESGEDWTQIAL